MRREGLLEAKKHFGTFSRLAKVLGVKKQTLSDWVSFRRLMPVRHVFTIMRLTQQQIPFSAFNVYLHPDDRKLDQWVMLRPEKSRPRKDSSL